jgi:hypothetical protein
MTSSLPEPDADRAAAILSRQPYARTRVLGVVSPGPAAGVRRGYQSDILPVIYQSRVDDGRVTINSSASSPATPAVISGAGGAGAPETAPIFLGSDAEAAPIVIAPGAGAPLTVTSGALTQPLAPAATTTPTVAEASATAPPHTAATSPLVVRSGRVATANGGAIVARDVNGKVIITNDTVSSSGD